MSGLFGRALLGGVSAGAGTMAQQYSDKVKNAGRLDLAKAESEIEEARQARLMELRSKYDTKSNDQRFQQSLEANAHQFGLRQSGDAQQNEAALLRDGKQNEAMLARDEKQNEAAMARDRQRLLAEERMRSSSEASAERRHRETLGARAENAKLITAGDGTMFWASPGKQAEPVVINGQPLKGSKDLDTRTIKMVEVLMKKSELTYDQDEAKQYTNQAMTLLQGGASDAGAGGRIPPWTSMKPDEQSALVSELESMEGKPTYAQALADALRAGLPPDKVKLKAPEPGAGVDPRKSNNPPTGASARAPLLDDTAPTPAKTIDATAGGTTILQSNPEHAAMLKQAQDEVMARVKAGDPEVKRVLLENGRNPNMNDLDLLRRALQAGSAR